MNPRSFCFPKSAPRLLAAALCSLALGGACSSDEDAPPTPITFGVEIATLDGRSPDEAVELRCDRGGPGSASDVAAGGAGQAVAPPAFFSTLAVAVATTPDQAFFLRPAHACGASTRCGYVRIEGLDDAGEVVAKIETSTTEGVLQLDLARLPTQIRVSLIRGLDQEPLMNPDETAVTASVTPSFVVPTCADIPGGAGGAGGAAGAGSAGEASAGQANAGGAGAMPFGGAEGAGGAGPVTPFGGAGGADNASSGAGGA